MDLSNTWLIFTIFVKSLKKIVYSLYELKQTIESINKVKQELDILNEQQKEDLEKILELKKRIELLEQMNISLEKELDNKVELICRRISDNKKKK